MKIAFCGLDCHQCPTFKATQADDDPARARTAAMLNQTYGFNMTVDDINCDGCHSQGSRLIRYCQACAVRQCGRARGLDNCTACPDQPCEKLLDFHAFSPDARAAYDRLITGST